MTDPRRHRALLIGNASFPRDPHGLSRLRGPAADLRELAGALTDERTGLFAPGDVTELPERGVQELREALHEFFVESAERDDVLLLYYSGHGKLDLLGNLHLCAEDSRTGSLPVTALRYKQDVESLIDASPATTTVAVLDCCYSGAFRGGDFFVDATGRGKCVISSSRADELALDATGEGGTSPFTGALVQGLRTVEPGGRLTTRQLYDRIGVLLSGGGNARPQFHFDGEGEIVIAGRPDGRAAPPRAEPSGGPRRSNTTGPRLPEARNRRESVLNEAMRAAFEAPDDDERLGAVAEVVATGVDADADWAERVLWALPHGDIRDAVVSGVCRGLAEADAERAMRLVGELPEDDPGKVEQLTALAEAVAVDGGPAAHLLSEAVRCLPRMPGDMPGAAAVLARLGALLESAGDPGMSARVVAAEGEESRERKAAVLAAARTVLWDRTAVFGGVADRLEAVSDPSSRWRALVSVVGELGVADPPFASRLLDQADRIISEFHPEIGDVLPMAGIAASMVGPSPEVAHRLLDLAGRLADSIPPGEEKLGLLTTMVEGLASEDPSLAERFVLAAERLVARMPEGRLWQLSRAAESVALLAPGLAERLAHLVPDDELRIHALVSAARAMRLESPSVARRLADEAERIARSMVDDDDRFHAMLRVTEAYAAVDPDYLLRFLRAAPLRGSRLAVAYNHAGETLGETAPGRVQGIVDALGPEVDESLLSDMVEGVGEADAETALALAKRFPSGTADETKVLTQVVQTLSESDPARAEAVARAIRDEYYQAEVLGMVVASVAKSDPHHAARVARSIPDYEGSADDKVSAMATAALALHPVDARSAERLLGEAEHHAFSVDDARIHKASALTGVARGFAPFDRGRAERLLVEAERLAHGIEDGHAEYRFSALADIMVVWASIAPGQAERVAAAIPDTWARKTMYLEDAAVALARTGSRKVMRFVEMIADDYDRLCAVRRLVRPTAVAVPALAERLANELPAGRERASALANIAKEARSAGAR